MLRPGSAELAGVPPFFFPLLTFITPFIRAVLDRPGRWLAGFSLVTVLLGLGLLRLEMRTDGAALYPSGDPTVEATEADRRTFLEREQVILLLSSRPGGPALDSLAGLRHLKRLHTSLEGLPGVARLRSLATLPDPRAGTPLILVKPFLDELPADPEEHAATLDRIERSPLAHGLFLSEDGQAAAFYISVLGDRADFLADLEAWTAAHRTPDFDLRLTGPVVAEVMLGRIVLQDLAWLIPLMIGAVAVLLFLCLRTLGGVLVPLAEVVVVLVWTLGIMGLFGVPVTLVTTIVPVLLMTMAVTDEIHLLDRFQAHLGDAGGRGRGEASSAATPSPTEAMAAAFADVGRPIILTSITTAVAFLSFLTASMAPIRHFGLFTALGVLLAMVSSFTFVPALVMLLPTSWFVARRRRGRGAGDEAPPPPVHHRGILSLHQRLVVRWGGVAALTGLLLVLLCIPGLFRLTVQDAWIDNFPDDSELVATTDTFNRQFWGAYRFDVVLTHDEHLFFMSPAGLRLVDRIADVVRAGPHVGGVASHVIHYQIASSLEAEGPVFERPAESILDLARLLQRVRNKIDLDHYLGSTGASARIRLLVKSPNYQRARELEAYLERTIPPLLQGHDLSYHFSGDLPTARAVVGSIVGNMFRSVGWTVAGVGLLLLLVFRSLRAALAAMVPLVSGLLILLGGMGYAGIPLGIATSMFAALTIGVAIDFALHFSHVYRRERRAGKNHEAALQIMLATTGRAIRWNATVLTLGLLVLALSELGPNRHLGLLLAAGMAVCYTTTLLFLPWFLGRAWRGRGAGDETRTTWT